MAFAVGLTFVDGLSYRFARRCGLFAQCPERYWWFASNHHCQLSLLRKDVVARVGIFLLAFYALPPKHQI
jgi:hypothetical protein